MKSKNLLTESSEKYINAVYQIVKEQKAARVKDVSKYLNIGPSSVSEALRSLADKKLINYQPYGIITLTDEGEKIAQEIESRHEIICNFLKNVLLIEDENIDEKANNIEHGISEDVLEKFVRFLTFMQTCSCKEPKWIKSYKHYALNGELQDKCNTCIQKCKDSKNGINNKNCCGG